MSDAGTPGISDPGRQLAAECAARGLRVVPIPGPCAAVAAVSVTEDRAPLGSTLCGPRIVMLAPRGIQKKRLEVCTKMYSRGWSVSILQDSDLLSSVPCRSLALI